MTRTRTSLTTRSWSAPHLSPLPNLHLSAPLACISIPKSVSLYFQPASNLHLYTPSTHILVTTCLNTQLRLTRWVRPSTYPLLALPQAQPIGPDTRGFLCGTLPTFALLAACV